MSNSLVSTTPNTLIGFWRKELGWTTLCGAVTLLRHLGAFDQDTVTIIGSGYRHVPVSDLWHWYALNAYCFNIGPLCFRGGPFSSQNFQGNLLTMVLDRVLLVAYEKGSKHVLKVVKYVKLIQSQTK